MKSNSPYQRIVCLTEESVEFLYALNREDLIVGVSTYAVRPPAVKEKPVVSTFTHSNLRKIKEINPDLVIGFSDIQKDIAKNLIEMGLNVFISNQRSLNEILAYLRGVGYMIGEFEKTEKLIATLENKITETQKLVSEYYQTHPVPRPRVYIEEWNEPRIFGIRWFSELVELCGGEDIFHTRSLNAPMAADRFVDSTRVLELNPDIILACWCGKKVEFDAFYKEEHLGQTKAVQTNQIYELAPEIFLQPGPAPIADGIDQLLKIFGIIK